ncbi:MAG: G1 family glutamic endopeptidase [Thermoplasmata archaeon]
MKIFKKIKMEEAILIERVVMLVLSAVSFAPNSYASKSLTSVPNYNISTDISSNSNVSNIYNNFNTSLNNNINATINIAKQHNLPFYVGNLTTKIKSSFNAFLAIENILGNTSLYNDFSWGIEHIFTDNITFAEFSITFINGKNETMYTWQANESKPFILELSVKILPVNPIETTMTTYNWSGYEVYDLDNEVTAVCSPITVPKMQLANLSQQWGSCGGDATGAWVGISNKAGGFVQLAQTGYSNVVYPSNDFIPYALFYAVIDNKTVLTNSYYPNVPRAGIGYTFSFTVTNNGKSYTFTALNLSNTAQSYTVTYTPKTIDKTYYSEFIVEAPYSPTLSWSYPQLRLPEFSSPIDFTYPELYTTTWYYVGSFYPQYWNEYFLNQTKNPNYPYNIDIFNSWNTNTYAYDMTWNDSLFSLYSLS